MRSIDEIYGEMTAIFEKETGIALAGDGDMAVRLYAVAAQIYALYIQADWVNRQCFPQSAEGEYLDKHAQLRGLERREAVAAEGTIRFQTDSAAQADLTIPAGTVCMTAGLIRFETTQEVTLQAGETQVDAPAVALEPGTAGNVAAGTIRAMAVAPVGIGRCTNPEGFSGGLDAEDDETLRARVLETFQRMPNGANAAYYEQSAMSFPQVAAAAVVSRPRGVGSVDVVVATSAGVPDEELLGELQAYFEERREIAVDVQVRAPEVQNVDVTAQIQTAANRDGDTVRQNVEQAIRSWFNGQRLGQNILRAKLGQLIYEVDGVENYTLTAPAADVTVEHDVLPQLNTVSVTRTEGTA